MTVALLAALVVVNLLYVWHLERKDRRHDSQVNQLLQRIQDPEQAVIEHVADRSDGPLFINPEHSLQDQLVKLFEGGE